MEIDELTLPELVEVLRAEQRRRWQGGERVAPEVYFTLHPQILGDTTCAMKMVYNEVLLREAAGEKPRLDEYLRRFPGLTDQLAPLFDVHRALESDELLAAAGGDTCLDQSWSRSDPPMRGAWPTIAGHEILGELGRGGMGVVYKARQISLNRLVALKMILDGCHAHPNQLARFRAEAQAVARLQHPNIVQIHEVAEQDGRPYFSLEFVDGGNLAQALKGEPQPARLAAGLIQTLARAIHAAHQRGIVHRDLKPANILLQRQNGDGNAVTQETEAGAVFVLRSSSFIPKITDFGLAKQLDVGAGLTVTGMTVGTPSYMAPEQANSSMREIGPATDVYALGAILYELLTGRPPFRAETHLDTLRQVVGDDPVPLSRFHLKVPRDLNTICTKCLRKEPHKRYASALSLAEDLERFLANQPIHARRPSMPEQVWRWSRRHPALACLAGLVVTVAVGASLAALRLRTEQDATLAQLHKTEEAQAAGKRRLFDSLLAQARASRLSQRMGRRFKTLDLVAEAAELARSLNLGEDEFRKLRSEAASCLALTDVRVDQEWPGWPMGTFSVDFDGALEHYARVDQQGTVSIRRVADDAELYHLPSLAPEDAYAGFSADGRFLAQLSLPHLKWWKLTGDGPVLVRQVDDCRTCNFSPDSRQFVVGHPDGTISLYDLGSGQRTQQLRTTVSFTGLAFDPQSRRLAVTGENGMQVLDLATGNVLAEMAHGISTKAPAWHPEGGLLAVAGSDGRITLWDVSAGKPRLFMEGYRNTLTQLAFNHAGDLLATYGWEGILRLWDPRTGKQLFAMPAGMGTLRFSRDDRRLAAGAAEGNALCIWEVAAGREYRTLGRDKGAVGSPACSLKQRLLAATVNDGVQLYDLANHKELAFLRLPRAHVLFEPSGALVTNGPAGVWRWPARDDPASPGLVHVGPPERLPLPGSDCQLAGSCDGRVLAIAQLNNGGLVLHADHAQQPIPLRPHGDVRYIAVSPDGRFVATGSHNETGVKIWESQTGKHVKDLLAGVSFCHLGFSPDGKWLLTSGDGCRLWAVDSWQERLLVGGGAFAFSGDSSILAVESGGGVVRLVDPGTGREYARLEDPDQDSAGDLSFSPDGTELIVSASEGPTRIWDLRAIRRQLADMGLDWELPSYPPPPPEKHGQPLRIVVDLGPSGPDPLLHARRALASCSLALALQPLNHEAHYRRALARTLLKQWPGAVDDCTRSLALRPDQVQVYYLRSELQQRLGQHRQALTDLSEAVQREPGRVPPFEELQKALLLEPHSPEDYNDLAWQYVSGPVPGYVPGLAVFLAEKAVLLEPDSWYYQNTLGVAYYRLGQWGQAAEILEGALPRSRGRFDAFDLFFLAMTYQRLGRADRARECYERANRWWQAHDPLSRGDAQELTAFRTEAAAVLGLP